MTPEALLVDAIKNRLKTRTPLLVAIDGRSASGKTSLALRLKETAGACVIHMDHFFPRPEQRTPERLARPGGNVDYERFLSDVIAPLKRGEPFSYRPFNCHTMTMGDAIEIKPHSVTIVEGAYACHPALWDLYDLHVFLSIDPAEQARRILRRNGEADAAIFRDKWIPMEERYFEAFQIPEKCDFFIKVEASPDY